MNLAWRKIVAVVACPVGESRMRGRVACDFEGGESDDASCRMSS